MQIKDEEKETLRKLEESLWIASTRFDFNYMNRILAHDFFEFGRSGRGVRQTNDRKANAT
ncbi:MAG: hypothetical protein KDK55_07125 [Chlamydiia bacterium]|nr:hypothetical protein [Chlamydiia bacterium]